MNLRNEMVDVFGEENLVYAHPSSLSDVKILDTARDFISKIGFPRVVGYFRFSMDFEPLWHDIQIGHSTKHLGQLFTIGCEGVTQLIGRTVQLCEIDLDNNASLSSMGRKIEVLGIDDAIFVPEVTLAPRICFNLESNGEIELIAPSNLSVSFFNSSIEQLAASLIAYKRSFLSEKDFSTGLEGFRKKLESIDPKALENQKNVWVVVMERLIRDEDGY